MTRHSTSIVAACFDKDAPRESVRLALKLLGFADRPDPHVRWHPPGLLTAEVEGDLGAERAGDLGAVPGLVRIAVIPSDRRLTQRRAGEPRVTVRLPGGAAFGGGDFAVIAGPCSVESEAQVCEIAAKVKEAGASALRGGVFKPRTSPYSFAGLGETGLEYLARARESTGLPVVTEALDVDVLDVVARYADLIQIGSRNMQNFLLLFRAGCHPMGRPVLLKRGFAATLEEFLLSAEYVMLGRLLARHEGAGIVLCERGIRTFETSTRFTLDVGALPVLDELTPLPVIVDPSHAAGERRYVTPLARAAVAAGADGLLVEVHTDPPKAWTDGAQCLDPSEFSRMMEEVRALVALRGAGRG